jgi:hypothetical protein
MRIAARAESGLNLRPLFQCCIVITSNNKIARSLNEFWLVPCATARFVSNSKPPLRFQAHLITAFFSRCGIAETPYNAHLWEVPSKESRRGMEGNMLAFGM